MDSFAPMLAQRPLLEAAGIRVEPITNHKPGGFEALKRSAEFVGASPPALEMQLGAPSGERESGGNVQQSVVQAVWARL